MKTKKKDKILCITCHTEVFVTMTRTFLGGRKYYCPECKKYVQYPRTIGYLIVSLIALAYCVYTNFGALYQMERAGYNIPLIYVIKANWTFNLGAVLILFGLTKDLFLRMKVHAVGKETVKQTERTKNIQSHIAEKIKDKNKFGNHEVTCSKCGGTTFEYDDYYKEYTCDHCGNIENGK